MKHYQYRIVETKYADGHEEYTVQWRDDWFGTGIFWLSSWYVCSYRNIDGIRSTISYSRRFFAIFDTKEEAIDFLTKRKEQDHRYQQSQIVTKKTVINP